MTAYRLAVYRAPRRYRSPSRRRNGASGPVIGIAAGIALASGVSAHAVTTVHAKPHVQPARAAAVAGPGETDFIVAVLAGLGAPDTAANRRSLSGWFPHEFPSWPPRAKNNPMSSTLPMPGSWTYNTLADGLHVQNYRTASEGAEATARTLDDGWYPGIVAALRSGEGICGPGFAGELLTWSGNGYAEVC